MFQRITFVSILVLSALLTTRSLADDAKKTTEPSASELSLDIEALQTFYYFNLTPEQMKAIQKLAKETAQKPRQRNAKASKECEQTLADLRKALLDEDEDQIDNLSEQLDQLKESEKPELDDDVEITNAARIKTADVMRLLKPHQLAGYLAAIADDVIDPRDHLVELLGKVRGLNVAEWKEQREELAESISLLVAGVDAKKAARVNDQVIALLAKTRIMNDKEYQKQRPALEKEARKIVGEIKALDMLGHLLEHTVAEMLSNPRLEAALEARLSK